MCRFIAEDREFQLITWSKDRRLRMIPVQRDVLAVSSVQASQNLHTVKSRVYLARWLSEGGSNRLWVQRFLMHPQWYL
jgi:hypothetical protein